MKYGMRERLSGAVILIALAVIFVPMLFDEPAPRGERPEPSQRIEAPIEVERHDVPAPVPPASLGDGDATAPDEAPSPATGAEAGRPEPSAEDEAAEPPAAAEATAPEPAEAQGVDPIAELARAADERLAQASGEPSQGGENAVPEAVAQGEWAVQVGSFGEPANAERLLARLRDEGFDAYSRPRGDELTTVYVGPYASAEAGERAVAEVKARVNLQGLLVRVRE
ncbi:DedD protein [Halomonas shengliensis]|uniref:DedD protein n=1 Tax=Halomonas shengliensis TaxID=419597 RepID=A0A1H0IT56_9GAMM|nr:SPOR domain-containing protein [Halomonas shengliensis]SDO34618.1 DedD protein [Halomonas shengliensis]